MDWLPRRRWDGQVESCRYLSYNLLRAGIQDNWNAFGCAVSEDLLLGTAQKIVDYGLRDLGYHYVILDDCWSAGRSSNGTLMANMTKFPNGMGHVADQLHSMGLWFGMYSSAGTYTCGHYGRSSCRTYMYTINVDADSWLLGL